MKNEFTMYKRVECSKEEYIEKLDNYVLLLYKDLVKEDERHRIKREKIIEELQDIRYKIDQAKNK